MCDCTQLTQERSWLPQRGQAFNPANKGYLAPEHRPSPAAAVDPDPGLGCLGEPKPCPAVSQENQYTSLSPMKLQVSVAGHFHPMATNYHQQKAIFKRKTKFSPSGPTQWEDTDLLASIRQIYLGSLQHI